MSTSGSASGSGVSAMNFNTLATNVTTSTGMSRDTLQTLLRGAIYSQVTGFMRTGGVSLNPIDLLSSAGFYFIADTINELWIHPVIVMVFPANAIAPGAQVINILGKSVGMAIVLSVARSGINVLLSPSRLILDALTIAGIEFATSPFVQSLMPATA